MNARTRFRGVMAPAAIDRVPWLDEGLRDDVLTRWASEGMPTAGPAAVFSYDRRTRIDVDLGLRPPGAKGLVQAAELPAWRRNLERPLADRLGPDWPARTAACRSSDAILELPVHSGLFLTLGADNWQSLEDFMYMLADEPAVVEEALTLQGELIRRVVEAVLAAVPLDMLSFSEPIGDNHGPLVGPAMYRDLVLKANAGVLELAGRAEVPAIVFMTYANARCLLPVVRAAGFNCLWAMETESRAMDYRALRADFGRDLRLIGGIDLDALLAGPAAIDAELRAKVPPLLAQGRYIPLADGRVRASVPWPAYVHYRQGLERLTQ